MTMTYLLGDRVPRRIWRHTMKRLRRTPQQVIGAAVAALALSTAATAQSYPSRPITMIMPFVAGGITDVAGRVLAERMRLSLGQPIMIENVTGAEGSIGSARAARARPDGYTISYGSISTHVLNGAFHSLTYDGLNDFTPISPEATTSYVLYARKTMPAKDLNEFIGWLKANPNKASAAFTVGGGHLITALFQKETGTQFSLVPYRGLPYQDLMAGQIDFGFLTPNQLPLVRAGSLKAYAVSGDMRLALAPDIPTLVEMGLPISFSAWGALFAPKGTPRKIIGKLNAAVVEALADPAVQAQLADLGAEIFPREQQTPEALDALVKADAEKWWPLIKELGVKIE
jgi:tripartite-type tricarboxylate transporter receptor subunit TctC